MHRCSQEKPALWAQILEANEADEDEVEHFVDAPALDEGSPTSGARIEAPAEKAVLAEAAATDKEPGQGTIVKAKMMNGYDIAKR